MRHYLTTVINTSRRHTDADVKAAIVGLHIRPIVEILIALDAALLSALAWKFCAWRLQTVGHVYTQ